MYGDQVTLSPQDIFQAGMETMTGFSALKAQLVLQGVKYFPKTYISPGGGVHNIFSEWKPPPTKC